MHRPSALHRGNSTSSGAGSSPSTHPFTDFCIPGYDRGETCLGLAGGLPFEMTESADISSLQATIASSDLQAKPKRLSRAFVLVKSLLSTIPHTYFEQHEPSTISATYKSFCLTAAINYYMAQDIKSSTPPTAAANTSLIQNGIMVLLRISASCAEVVASRAGNLDVIQELTSSSLSTLSLLVRSACFNTAAAIPNSFNIEWNPKRWLHSMLSCLAAVDDSVSLGRQP